MCEEKIGSSMEKKTRQNQPEFKKKPGIPNLKLIKNLNIFEQQRVTLLETDTKLIKNNK